MPRLRQVARDETESELVLAMYDQIFGDRDPVSEPGTPSGTPGDWWTVFALVLDILRDAARGFALYRTPTTPRPRAARLAQTRAGWARGSQFVFSQHCKSLRALGVSDEAIAAIPAWSTADSFTPPSARSPGLCRLPRLRRWAGARTLADLCVPPATPHVRRRDCERKPFLTWGFSRVGEI